MATVTYFINPGIPCGTSFDSGVSGVTLKEAKEDFARYQAECERTGNSWRDAYMDVVFDMPSHESRRVYELGPRGGIRQVEE